MCANLHFTVPNHLIFVGRGSSTDIYEKYSSHIVDHEKADWTGLTLSVSPVIHHFVSEALRDRFFIRFTYIR